MRNKILVPLNEESYISDFIECGADEFYMGFYDDEYTRLHGEFSEINQMSGFRKHANKYNFQQCLSIIKKIKDINSSIYITFNSAAYSQVELDSINKYMREIAKAGADGVIVSTPELCNIAVRNNLSPVASIMCNIYNSDIATFYKNLGVKRMILPRDLGVDEIEDIVNADKNIDYEIFLMRHGCKYSNGFCLGTHRPEKGSICHTFRVASSVNLYISEHSSNFQNEMKDNQISYTNDFHMHTSCGLCALYRFVKLGIASYKIVGREDNPDKILNDIRLVKENIKIAQECDSEEEFLDKMKKLDNTEYCKQGLNCYYPEIRFK